MDDDDCEDEELLLLRIKALKSSARVNSQVEISSDYENDTNKQSCHKQGKYEIPAGNPVSEVIDSIINIEAEDDKEDEDGKEDELTLREIALESIRKPSQNPRTNSGNMDSTLTQTKDQKEFHIKQHGHEEVDNVELALREQALKTLLHKRTKTGNLLKKNVHAVQHQLVSSTSGNILCSNKKLPPEIPVQKQIESKEDTVITLHPRCELRENITITLPPECKYGSVIQSTNSVESKSYLQPEGDIKDSSEQVVDPPKTPENPSVAEKNIIKTTHEYADYEKAVLPNELYEHRSGDNELDENRSSEYKVDIDEDDQISICASDRDDNELSSVDTELFTSANIKSTAPKITETVLESNLNTDEQCIEILSVRERSSTAPEGVQCSLITSCSQTDAPQICSENNIPSTIKRVTCEDADNNSNELSAAIGETFNLIHLTDSSDVMYPVLAEEYSSVKKCNSANESENSEINSEKEIGASYALLGLIMEQTNDIIGEDLPETNENQGLGEKHNECEPGPSGLSRLAYLSNSDSDHSIVEVTPPNKEIPAIIHLSSGSDVESSKQCRKGKRKKSREVVIKETLRRQSGFDIDYNQEDVKDVSCSICLCVFENRSFLNQCLHSFCYVCIIQWAELSRLCPLCKSKYTSLIHSVTKDLDYEQYDFPDDPREKSKKQIQQIQREFSETMDDGRRFRYRSTLVDHETWADRRAERERVEQERAQTRQLHRISRRLKWSATKDRRKAVYRMNMVVQQVKQRRRPKYRDISPKFFKENPAMKHRLVPWLLRDLNVLLGDDDENIRFVMSLILNTISNIPVDGDEFKKQLSPFLFNETQHFVAELTSFATSPYDIKGYDDNVVYDVPAKTVTIESEDAIPTQTEDPIRERLLNEIFLGNNESESTPMDASTCDNNSEELDKMVVNDLSDQVSTLENLSRDQDETREQHSEHNQDESTNQLQHQHEGTMVTNTGRSDDVINCNEEKGDNGNRRDDNDAGDDTDDEVSDDEQSCLKKKKKKKKKKHKKKKKKRKESKADEKSFYEGKSVVKPKNPVVEISIEDDKKDNKTSSKRSESDSERVGKTPYRNGSESEKVSKVSHSNESELELENAGEKSSRCRSSLYEENVAGQKLNKNPFSGNENEREKTRVLPRSFIDADAEEIKHKQIENIKEIESKKKRKKMRKHKKKQKLLEHKKRRKDTSSSSSDSDNEDKTEKHKKVRRNETHSENRRKNRKRKRSHSKNTEDLKRRAKNGGEHESDTSEEKRGVKKQKRTHSKSENMNNALDSPKKVARNSKKGARRRNSTDSDSPVQKKKKNKKKKSSGDNETARKLKKKRKEKKKRKHRKHKLVTKGGISSGSSSEENGIFETLLDKIRSAQDRFKKTEDKEMSKVENSSDDDDNILTSEQLQEFLQNCRQNKKLDLIKDGDGYKTRAEVVHELLLIEKAINRRREKKDKVNVIDRSHGARQENSHESEQHSENSSEDFRKDKKKESYKDLVKELQEIDRRINSCRSSLQVRPGDLPDT